MSRARLGAHAWQYALLRNRLPRQRCMVSACTNSEEEVLRCLPSGGRQILLRFRALLETRTRVLALGGRCHAPPPSHCRVRAHGV